MKDGDLAVADQDGANQRGALVDDFIVRTVCRAPAEPIFTASSAGSDAFVSSSAYFLVPGSSTDLVGWEPLPSTLWLTSAG